MGSIPAECTTPESLCKPEGDKNEGFAATQGMLRKEPVWVVNIPRSLVGKRSRIYRPTKAEALAAANENVDEHRIHGAELTGLTTAERAFALWLRERGMTVKAAQKILAEAPSALGSVMKQSRWGRCRPTA